MMTEPECVLVELPPPELGAAFLAQADNAISVAAEAIQTRRAVLVDDFTYGLLRTGGSRAPADALPGFSRLEYGRVPGPVQFKDRIANLQ
jgi:hypothetical protein